MIFLTPCINTILPPQITPLAQHITMAQEYLHLTWTNTK